MALIRLEDLHKFYGEGEVALHVLKSIELSIPEHQYVAIVGASGSGKSTLMNILGCLDTPTSGTYLLKGQNVSDLSDDRLSEIRNLDIGFVFQSFQLIPQLTVLENVEVPLFYAGVSKSRRHERGRKVLEEVGLSGRLRHLPTQLSGGERQRVAIARALINDPLLLLADEPTGNLDSHTGEEILRLFDRLHQSGRAIVLVTHDAKVADLTERRITLRDGEVVEDVATGSNRTGGEG